MKLHRFIGNFDLSGKEIKIQNPEIIKQIKAVFRLGVGDKIILLDGVGREVEATILSLHPEMRVRVGKNLEKTKSHTEVNLYMAIIKKGNFELGLQKAVEAGVSSITPIITARTVKTGLNMERLEKIIREASEQSGRSVVPRLHSISNFEDAIVSGTKAEVKMIFDPGGKFYKASKEKGVISIFIGPEGGFTDKEIARAKENGYGVFSLGPLILRAETAAMITTYRAANNI